MDLQWYSLQGGGGTGGKSSSLKGCTGLQRSCGQTQLFSDYWVKFSSLFHLFSLEVDKEYKIWVLCQVLIVFFFTYLLVFIIKSHWHCGVGPFHFSTYLECLHPIQRALEENPLQLTSKTSGFLRGLPVSITSSFLLAWIIGWLPKKKKNKLSNSYWIFLKMLVTVPDWKKRLSS